MSVCSIELQPLFSVSHSTVCLTDVGLWENTVYQLLRVLILTDGFLACFLGSCVPVSWRVSHTCELTRQISSEKYVFCCPCQDMLLHTQVLVFITVPFNRSHDCDAAHLCLASKCLLIALDDSSLQTGGTRGSGKTDSTSGPGVVSGAAESVVFFLLFCFPQSGPKVANLTLDDITQCDVLCKKFFDLLILLAL